MPLGGFDTNLAGLLQKRRFGALTPQPQPPTGGVVTPGTPPGPGQPSIQSPPPGGPSGPGMPSIQPMVPSPQPSVGGAQYGAITPQNNLVGTSITPNPSPDTATARGDVSQGLASLQTAPDRNTLAQETFKELSAQTDPAYQASLRAATQAGAGAGRLGSGMLTEELTSDPYGASGLGLQRQQYLGNLGKEIATESAGQTLQDRLNQLSAGQGVLGQFSGLDQQSLNNLTGERGYEHGLSQEAFQNNMQQNELLSQLGGFGQVTPQTSYAQGADQAGQGGDLLRLLLQNKQTKPQDYGYGAASPTYSGDPNGGGGYG